MNGGTKRERGPASRRAASRKREPAALLFLPGLGLAVFDGATWSLRDAPVGLAGVSFDGRTLGGPGASAAAWRGAGGDVRGIGPFLDLCTEAAAGERVGSKALLEAVNEARVQAGREPVTYCALADELKRRSVVRVKSNRAFWGGLRLRPPPHPPPRRSRRRE